MTYISKVNEAAEKDPSVRTDAVQWFKRMEDSDDKLAGEVCDERENVSTGVCGVKHGV
jgi:hypothetical protein